MNDEMIEQEIQGKGLMAARITPEHIDRVCHKPAQYHVFPGTTLTVCCLELHNGFTVTGESACASPENFDKELGGKIALQNAKAKVGAVEGYVLREWLFNNVDDSQPSWDDAPDWQKNSAMLGGKLHIQHPDAGPQASHESWMAQKLAEGWVHGLSKCPETKQHPCMVPFDQLPREQQAKDYIFRAVVLALTTDDVRGPF